MTDTYKQTNGRLFVRLFVCPFGLRLSLMDVDGATKRLWLLRAFSLLPQHSLKREQIRINIGYL